MTRIRLPFPSRIRWQLVLAALIVTGAATLIGSLLLLASFADIILHFQEQGLSAQSQLIASQMVNGSYLTGPADGLRAEVVRQAEKSNSRLVLFDANGVVLADSEGVSPPGSKPDLRLDLGPRLERGGTGYISLGWTPFHGYDAYSVAPMWADGQRLGSVALIQNWLRPGWQFDFAPSLIYGRLITAAFAVVLILIFAALIARPLEKMIDVAHRLAAGEFSARVKSDYRGEVGELARTIDSMADALERMLAEQQRLDQVRRELLADASHEIRSPLARMQVAIQALLDGVVDGPGEQREYLENVKEDVVQLSRLTSDLFDLSKLELGQMNLDIQPLSLTDALERTATRFRPLAAAQGVAITTLAPASLPLALGDPDRIAQVLANLIGNALRYTPSGGTVRLQAETKGNWAYVSVDDEGQGIPFEALPHVFDRFYRVDKSRSRQSGGTGLGLTIARGIICAHGGEISVESSSEQGSRFTFTLHLVPPPEARFKV